MTIVFVRHRVDYDGKIYHSVWAIESYSFSIDNDGNIHYFNVCSSHSDDDNTANYSEIYVGGVCVYKETVDKAV